MAVQCTGSIAPGPGRIRDFRHRLVGELGPPTHRIARDAAGKLGGWRCSRGGSGRRRPGAESLARAGKPAAGAARRRQPNLKVNSWVVYRGTTPIATAATEREAVDAAGRYLSDPAAGLMHLRPAVGDELPPSGGHRIRRAALVQSLGRLVMAAERAGDTDAADALKQRRGPPDAAPEPG